MAIQMYNGLGRTLMHLQYIILTSILMIAVSVMLLSFLYASRA